MRKITLSPRILLVGTGSLLNYGCEAIVQGTYELFREFWPECQLTIASDDTEYDNKVFSGYENIHFMPYKRRYTPYRLLTGVLRRIGIGEGSPVRMNPTVIDDFDIFLSVGGDNFGQAPDGSLYHILLDLMKIGERAKKKGKFYVLWGASVGPFDPPNLGIVGSHLSKADLLFPREEITFSYLGKTIGIPNEKNHLVADPAFWMKPDYEVEPVRKKKNELLIGLNISSLSIDFSFSEKSVGTKILFSALDHLLTCNLHYRYLCIPHVMMDDGGPQDDLTFLRGYYEFSKFKDRIEILDFGFGARKTKGIISQCDLLIASRMHCCVAGISSATPTLLLTYSRKGTGLAQYAYGNLSMALPVTDISEECLVSKVKVIEESLLDLKNHLNLQKARFRQDASVGILNIKKLYLNK